MAQPSSEGDRALHVTSFVSMVITVVGWLLHRQGLGLSLEEYRWQGTFASLAARGYGALWSTPIETWRPMCASLLVATQRCGLDTASTYGLSAALLVCNAALASALAWRLRDARGALTAFAVALVAATHDEVYLWLGGRCDLVFGVFGLLCAHAMLTSVRTQGAQSWIASLVAAGLGALAATSKETGLLLPIALVPLVWKQGTSPRKAQQLLAPLVLASWVMAIVRGALMRDPFGHYIGAFVHRGPSAWAHNLAVGVSRLVMGPAVHPSTTVALAVGALALAGGLVIGARKRARWPTLVGLGVLFVPVALLPADRALYPVVLAGAVIAGVALARELGIAPWLLAGWMVLQSVSGVVMQARWVDGYRRRAAYVAALQPLVVRGRPMVLVGGRQFFHGLYLEGPSVQELRGATAVEEPCRVAVEFPMDTQSIPSRTMDGRNFTLPHGTRCFPTVLRWPLRSAQQHGDVLALDFDRTATVVVWWDATGTARSMLVAAP